MSQKGTVNSIQQLMDEFLEGFCARQETLKVEETNGSSETDGRSSFASLSMMLKKMENNVGTRTHPCLMLLGDGEAARQ